MARRRKHIAPLEAAIGERLRELRKRRGLTQVEIAAKLGINQSVVSEYELGEVRLHGALLVELAKMLRVSADQILGLDEIKDNGVVKNRRLVRRLQQVDQLPIADQRALIRFLDALLARQQLAGRSSSRQTSPTRKKR